jgi:hypothetical protein
LQPLIDKTAVTGTLNDPSTPHTHWTIEVALPLYKLVYNTTASAQPQNGAIRSGPVHVCGRRVGGKGEGEAAAGCACKHCNELAGVEAHAEPVLCTGVCCA